MVWAAVALLVVGVLVVLPLGSSGAGRPAAPAHELLAPSVVPPQVAASPSVGGGPLMSVVDPATGDVYTVNSIANTVSVLSGTTVIANVSVSNATYSVGDPVYLVYDAGNGWVYAVDRYSFEAEAGAVSVISGTSLVGIVPIGLAPYAGAYDPADGYVYVSEATSGKVAILNGLAEVANVAVGKDPGAAVYDPADQYVYVANRGAASVTALAGISAVGTVPVGTDPDAFAYDPALGAIYVANNGSANVTLVNATDEVGSAATGANPAFVVVDASNGLAYVADRNASAVTVLDGAVPAGTIPTAAGPVWAAYGAGTGYVYVVASVGDAVTVIDGSVAIGNVSVGSGPTSGVWAPGPEYLYVTNSNTHNESILAVAYALFFNETGLAGSTPWSVTAGGRTIGGTASSLVFPELPGPRTYTIGTPAGYRLVSATPGSPVSVGSGPTTVRVVFAAASGADYALTFDETGLSSMCGRPTSWSVTVGNATETGTGSSIVFSEPNGTYNYTVTGPSGVSIVSETPASPVTIAGAPVTVAIEFGRGGYSATYSITFAEQGLPWGATWCVELAGSTVCSSGQQIVVSALGTGAYAFSVPAVGNYTATPSSGTVYLEHHDAYQRIDFSAPRSGHHCGGGGGGGGGWGPTRTGP